MASTSLNCLHTCIHPTPIVACTTIIPSDRHPHQKRHDTSDYVALKSLLQTSVATACFLLTNCVHLHKLLWSTNSISPSHDRLICLFCNNVMSLVAWCCVCWKKLRTLIHLFHSQCNGKPPNDAMCSGGGTPHKPSVIGRSGQVIHEATSCAKYLLSRNVPASCILKETSSYDTVGNAYYSLVIHAIPADWHRIAVVTSAFHMPRTTALFEHMYGLVQSETPPSLACRCVVRRDVQYAVYLCYHSCKQHTSDTGTGQ